MATTVVRGKQIKDGSVQRDDLDAVTIGQAVVRKIIQGTNITISSTGADSGTGDVTINATGGGGGGGSVVHQTEIDFGVIPVEEAIFTISDASVSPTSIITGNVAYVAPTEKDLDELEMDNFDVKFAPGSGQVVIYIKGLCGYIADKFKINYCIG